ncbi:hypothetical protein QYE76_031776 [Lolium multiflorum]|uniref:Uncharacterized protein n=1 Tax=Lolium multiflorum TaxID=4521 RepID=A0AAD8VKR0_LOLMU|nr:hypothetical protein QYE76_031776 [Lolium multiflorum]
MLYASDATLPKIDGRTPAFPKIGRRTPAIPKIDRRTPPPRTLAKQIRRSALSSSSSIPSLTPSPDELPIRPQPRVALPTCSARVELPTCSAHGAPAQWTAAKPLLYGSSSPGPP